MGTVAESGCRRPGFLAFWALAVVLLLLRPSAYGDHLEVDGDILDGVDQGDCVEGSGGTAVDVEPTQLDWASLFNADGSVKPLPAGAVIAVFSPDDVAVRGNGDCTSFKRRNKNGDPLNTWESPGEGPPRKDDFSYGYAYLVDDEDNGDRLLYIGVERLSNNGASHVDFDVKQDSEITCRDCDNPGTFTGEHKLGDLLIAVDYERGGEDPQLRIFQYLNADGDLQILVDQMIPSLVACTVDDPGTPENEADIICVGVNTKTIDGGPWQNFDSHGNPVDCIENLTFTEVCVNLTRLGDLTGITLSEERCIQTILAKSRTSQSISSELKDYVCLPFDTCSNVSGYKYEVPGPACGEVDDVDCGAGPDEILGTEDDLITPLVGWQIALLDDEGDLVTTDGNGDPLANPTCTDEEGRYEFADVPNGLEYTVCEMLPDRLTVDEGPGEDLNCNGILGEPEENFVWQPCLPDSADGEFTGVSTDSLFCCATLGGLQYCYSDPFELSEDEQRDFRNFKQPLCVDLSGTKFCDINGDGLLNGDDYPLPGFCIVLKDDGGVVVDVAITDSDGRYTFSQVPCAASYVIEEDLTGAECSTSDQSADWVQTAPAGGQHAVDVPCDVLVIDELDFGNASVPTISCNAGDQDLVNDAGLCSAQFCWTPTANNACGEPLIECTAEGPDGPVTLSVNPTTGEVCGDFPAGCPAVTTVTCTVTTAATANIPELTDSCSFTVTVTDTESPSITCPPTVTVECIDEVPAADPELVDASDNCGDVSVIHVSDVSDALTCPETITRTYRATDTCGNSTDCTQSIVVLDTTPPVITCPPDNTFECDETVVFGMATATDNCDPDPEITYVDDERPGDCPQEKTIVRTWTATDDCGNTASCVQTIRVVDTTDPVITCPPDNTFECDEEIVFGMATATDNCDPDPEITYEDNETPGACPQEKTIVRTWTATDDCGNTDSCVQTITVVDTTPPVITCPPDATFECDEEIDFGMATATDNCDPDPAISFVDAERPGSCPQEKFIDRTWTATDACDNSDSCVQTITVVDTTPPMIVCPPNATFECDEPVVFGMPTVSDNCDPEPVVSFVDAERPGSCPQEKFIDRTWTVTDACGNSNSCVQTITVVDTTPPEITCPPDNTFECDEEIVFGMATATDNCDPDPAISFVDAERPGSCPQEMFIDRTWTATDACGNSNSCVQTITVVDTTPPEITCPPDNTFECDEEIVFGMATATDNCDPDPAITFVDVETPGDCPQARTIVRTWTATDACGNSDSCVQTITVVDTTAPVISNCPSDQEVSCGEPFEFTLLADDNCDPDPRFECSFSDAADPDRFIAEELGGGSFRLTLTGTTVVTVTCTAVDACGNTSEVCTFTVSATCNQACSPGFWKNNLSSWCDTGLYPEDGSCGDASSEATLFKDAFMITDFSSGEIPAGFDQDLTLLEAVRMSGGNFNQTLFHGSAALLSALSPDVGFPAVPDDLKSVMQEAFSGDITFADAAAYFKALNAVEAEGGCPLSGG